MDWTKASVGDFFRGPMIRTVEGLVTTGGCALSWLFAVLTYFVPSWVGVSAGLSAGYAVLFSLWPFALFTAFVGMCAPRFNFSVFTTVFMLLAAVFPLYLVYR